MTTPTRTEFEADESPDKASDMDEDSPMWLINCQIEGLLEGLGASEDHEDVIKFLRSAGLPGDTAARVHLAICCAEVKLSAATRVSLLAALRAASTGGGAK